MTLDVLKSPQNWVVTRISHTPAHIVAAMAAPFQA